MTATRIFLVAGEPSGDNLGAKLMLALKRATGGAVEFSGVGGERMAGEGLKSLFPLSDLSVMGLAEVVPRLPTIFARLRQTAEAIKTTRPDIVVLIDAPSFGLRVADRIRGSGIPVVQYVAPQLWAWRPGRAKKLKGRIDAMLALLPFEPDFFAKLGLACTHVGHPVLEDALAPADAAGFRTRHEIAAEAPLVAVLPGSRAGLFGRMAPIFAAAANALAATHPQTAFVVPYVANTEVASAVFAASLPGKVVRVADPAEKRAAFRAADAALSVSGTSTLELAVAGLPTVVGHRVNALSGWLARKLIQVPYVAMPNVIAGRVVIPELLQADCTPAALAAALAHLLDDPAAASKMRADLASVCEALGQGEIARGRLPSDRAATAILELLRSRG
jgi:lipid-A-disaccharide synthase